MKPAVEQHPSQTTLSAFVQGRLCPAEQADIELHIAACTSCCQQLATVPNDTLLEQLRATDTTLTLRSEFVLKDDAVPAELAAHPRYRIIKVLGMGGMGVVYQAEHRRMERQVALKVIHRSLLHHPTASERFQLEVKAAAKLVHPHIVTAYDADQAGALHFLVMEYVDGASLAHLVERAGPLPLGQACACVRQAALGLQHAFEQGMVHRDIKPQNLMLAHAGEVKILDFGLACFARTQEEPQAPNPLLPGLAAGLTEVGSIVGTPAFMAPEQKVNAHTVDIRADIYALGATLHYLLMGYPPLRVDGPFDGNTAVEAVPPAVAGILSKMLAEAPGDRYQTPAAVAVALAPLCSDAVAPAQTAAPSRRRSSSRLAVSTVLAAVLLGVAWGIYSSLPAPRPGTTQAAKPTSPVQPTSSMRGELPVLMLLAQDYQYADYQPLRTVLEGEGKQVIKIASSARSACKPVERNVQARVLPDVAFPQDVIKADSYAALVIPGGYIHMFKDDRPARQALWRFLDEMIAARKPIVAIDAGITVLAAAGKLRDKRVAEGRAKHFDQLLPSGARWQPQQFVQDEWLLTATTAAAPAAARQLLQTLSRTP